MWEDPETGSSLCGTAEQQAESLAELLVNRLNPRQRPMSERSLLTAASIEARHSGWGEPPGENPRGASGFSAHGMNSSFTTFVSHFKLIVSIQLKILIGRRITLHKV